MGNWVTLSYEQLGPAAAKVFRSLSVFPLLFDAEAEEVICNDPENTLLFELARRGLVVYRADRDYYQMHDEVRSFARSKLKENNEEESVLTHHAFYYKDVFHRATELYQAGGDNVLRGLYLFGQQWSNIEAGFRWAEAHLDDPNTAGLCSAYTSGGVEVLRLYLQAQMDQRWLESSLRSAQLVNDKKAEGKHTLDIALSYRFMNNLDEAREYFERALRILQEVGDKKHEAAVYGHLGYVFSVLGESNKAIEYFGRRRDLAHFINDKRGESIALHNLGDEYFKIGEKERAIGLYEQALNLARELKYLLHEGRVLSSLGWAYAQLQNEDLGLELEREALKISSAINDLVGQAYSYSRMADILSIKGDRKEAIELAEKARAIFKVHSPSDVPKADELLNKLRAA